MRELKKTVIIAAEDLELAYGDQSVLDKATLSIHEGERVGLVGRNGCGKSTFMKILAQIEEPSEGLVTRKKGLRTGFLSQEFTLDQSANVSENIKQGADHIIRMITEYESLPQNSPKAHQLEETINYLDGWNLDQKIASLISALKCPPQNTNIKSLSGGEKRRVALAKTLVSEPDFLLLDEPTNHLDIASIEWLEGFMGTYRGTCLLVTHDRYFLDRISTRFVELSRGKFQSFKGDYANYLKAKAEIVEREEIAEGKRQKFLKKELEWVRRGPKARTTKSQFRVDRYYDLESQKAPEQDLDIDLIIPPAARMGNRVVDITKAKMEYDNKILFENFSYEMKPGAKLGIVGPNGVGKTTLIKILTGQIQPVSGTIEISSNTQFNVIDQERLTLNDDKTVVEEIGEGYDYVMLGEERISIWGYLKRFLFTDERIRTKVGRLSGGERARLLLAKILKNGGNFIVLDEPTNDLDLSTLRLLEEAVIGFKGCVLLVSHDRYFLNRVCTGILAFEKGRHITYHEGNYDYYMSKRAEFLVGGKEGTPASNSKIVGDRPKPKIRKLKWKEERELETIEEKIAAIEAQVEELQALFLDPNFYKESGPKVKETQKKLEEIQSKRDQLYARWEELEAIKNAC